MINQLKSAFITLTRMPGIRIDDDDFDLKNALWAFPIVGLGLACLMSLVIYGLQIVNIPALAGAVIVVFVLILLTGALHEDGLADCADALGATSMKQLILGGARSGKSQFAEDLALASYAGKSTVSLYATLIYVATAPAMDDEMEAKITEHQARRGSEWQTIECTQNIAQILKDADSSTTILVDCLTLWLNNLTYENTPIDAAFKTLCDAIETSEADVILVSNELGMGLVPDAKLGREFRDNQGKLNQLVAQKVDKVALIVAGLPLWMNNT